jgi:FAD:protein FMN transferase
MTRPLVASTVLVIAVATGAAAAAGGRVLDAPTAPQMEALAVHRHEYAQVHMGLLVRLVLHARDEPDARRAAGVAFSRIAALDAMMSDYRPDSELNQLSRTAGRSRWVTPSPELFDVLARAVELARLSDGTFDPTVGPLARLWREARERGILPDPRRLAAAKARVGWRHVRLEPRREAVRLGVEGMRLDLGGIAKGWILQDAARVLVEQGVTSLLVEAGGDIVVGAAPPGQPGWRIDVPGAEPAFAARAARLTHAALATSGSSAQFVEIDGVRYAHIVDPRTGLGLTGDVTAYVIAPHGATADALATALAIAGPAWAPRLLARVEGVFVSVQ